MCSDKQVLWKAREGFCSPYQLKGLAGTSLLKTMVASDALCMGMLVAIVEASLRVPTSGRSHQQTSLAYEREAEQRTVSANTLIFQAVLLIYQRGGRGGPRSPL